MMRQPKSMTIAGWVLTVVIAAALTMSGIMKLKGAPEVAEQMVGKFGYPQSTMAPIGVTELCCLALFLFPPTSVIGAILLTGYLGGAVATHVRVNDPFFGPAIGGVLVWLAIFLREARLRALVPWRGSPPILPQ